MPLRRTLPPAGIQVGPRRTRVEGEPRFRVVSLSLALEQRPAASHCSQARREDPLMRVSYPNAEAVSMAYCSLFFSDFTLASGKEPGFPVAGQPVRQLHNFL